MEQRRIRLLFALTIAVILVMISLFIWRRSTSPTEQSEHKSKKLVEVVILGKSNLEKRIRLLGKLHPVKFAQLRAKKSDVVQQLLVHPGQQVKEKQLLLQLEQLQEQKAVVLAKQQMQRAQQKLQRAKRLAAEKSISQEKLQQAQEKQEAAQKQLQNTQKELEHTRIQAPFSGVCASVTAAVGDVVQKNDLLLTLQDDSTVYVHLQVPAYLLSSMQVGQMVWLHKQRGSITSVPQRVESKTAVAVVKARLSSCSGCVMGDMREVEWVASKRNNVLALPLSALFLKKDKQHVALVRENKIILKEVVLGLQTDKQAEIISGLQAGDAVVWANPQNLNEGMEVEVIKQTETSQ